ncbi:MAG: NAD-dependent epimerase/dehydratase family protein [Saprospiraceae bacterium]
MTERILLVGAGGQIGTVLTAALRDAYGADNVLASDLHPLEGQDGPTATLDATKRADLEALAARHRATQIYHLAAILSATGEKNPMWAWDINMSSLFNVLEVARTQGIQKVYYPSSIAVFGEQAPAVDTPQYAPLIPTTVYGISKVAGEHWANYYFKRYGLDVRSLRYPGIIGYQSMPGGGTTDYAVDIYHHAAKQQPYTCFLGPDTRLPMLYMDDAIRATIELMEAPAEHIKVRTSYNLAGMSFTPAEVTDAIRQHVPDFEVSYVPDFRQAIADSWPQSIDDSAARSDWGWAPRFDLRAMTADMLAQLAMRYAEKTA